MRIIGGEARGRRLFAPEGDETRPTSDKVREALFNIIRGDVWGAHVLDLFAGSGALGLEAISRGAESAVFCDVSKKAVAAVKRNIELMRCADKTRVIQGDWRSAVAGRYSLVFIDPPYRLTEVYAQAADALISGGHLTGDALIVMERAADKPIKGLDERFEIIDERKYRDTALTFVRIRQAEKGGGDA